MAGEDDVVLREGQLLPRGDPDLPFDEVDARHHLGDGVLDLQAGVHLHEEELVGTVCGDDELHRPGPRVVDTARGIAGGLADARPSLGVEQRRRRLLDHLLVAPLQAAFALTEMHDVAVLVREDLDLDVAGSQHEPLEEERVVAEGGRCLAAGTRERRGEVLVFFDQPHTLPAASG